MRCTFCDRQKPNLSLCSRCKKAGYCDTICQRGDWGVHRTKCGKPVAVVAAAADREVSFMKEVGERELCEFVVTVADLDNNLILIDAFEKYETNNKKKKSKRDKLIDEMSTYGSTIPFKLKYNHVAVRNSSVHGYGVFATKTIPEGVIATYYSCDAIHDLNTTEFIVFRKDDGLDLTVDDPDITQIASDYKFQLCLEYNLTIVGNPRRRDNPLLVGHLVNEGSSDVFAGVDVMTLENNKELVQSLVLRYLRETTARRNCRFLSNTNNTILCLVTTRPIEEGEELFVTYSTRYWIEKNYGHDFEEKYPFIYGAFKDLSDELRNEIKSYEFGSCASSSSFLDL